MNYTLKHPTKDWKSDVYAVKDPELMNNLLEHEGDCFYISKWYRKSECPGTGLDNRHAMSGRIV
jgi:hypothetical protein